METAGPDVVQVGGAPAPPCPGRRNASAGYLGKGSGMLKRIVAPGRLGALMLFVAPSAAFADGHHRAYRQGYHHGYEHGYHRGYQRGYRRGYERGEDRGYWHGRSWDHRGSYWYGWNWDQQCDWAWYNDPAWYQDYCA